MQFTTTKRKRCTCSRCGKEGHNANNKLFHPDSIPKAKAASDRQTSKSAAQQPTHNCGEVDDEDEPPELLSDSEDEDSDDDTLPGLVSDSESEFGEEALFWEEDDEAHNPVQLGPIEAQLPPFKGPKSGPHLADALDMDPTDPVQAFALFWPGELLEKMRVATSSYGRLYIKRWTKEVSFDEMQAFLGLVIHLGLINSTGYRQQLWENTWKGNQFVRSVMTYSRFEMILKAWHYVDYAKYTAEEIKENKRGDPFWPVASLEGELNEIFRNKMNAGQCMDIDEQCIPWKGRHKCRCYNKSKPIKRHFKIFSLNDSRSGYQYGFYLYRGKQENRPANVSATSYPAYKLLDYPIYKDVNHVLFTDNWFTSLQQLEICLRRGMHMIGTVQQKRKGIPFSFKTTHGQRQQRQRGDFTSVKAGFYVNEEINDDIYYTAWLDRKPVGILHTIPTKLGSCYRMVKTKNDGWQRQEYVRPTIIPVYNYGMGGTDSGDQRMEVYRPELKTISWVPRVLSHFLNSAIVNSFIWYNTTFPLQRKSHYDFREALVNRLTNDQISEKVKQTGQIQNRTLTLNQWSKQQSRFVGAHWTVQMRKPEDLRIEGANPADSSKERTRNWFRGHCIICGRIVPTKCEQCNAYLCTDFREENDTTCMKYFHHQKNLTKTSSTAANDED